MQFVIKHSSHNVMNINYNSKIINISAVKFLGTIISNNIVMEKPYGYDYTQIKPSLLYS
jgi:hypothetical protein